MGRQSEIDRQYVYEHLSRTSMVRTKLNGMVGM